MKSQFLKKISIAGISLLFFFSCNAPSEKSEENKSEISNIKTAISFTIKEFKIIDYEEINIDTLFIQVAFELNPQRWILIARNIDEDPEGLKLLLIDPTKGNKLLYRSKGAYESMILHPTFFVPDNEKTPWVILCALGMDESWGQNLFFMNGDEINEIAYLDIAKKEDADPSLYENGERLADIAPDTKVIKNKTGYHFTFGCDSIIYFGELGDKVDPILKGSSIGFTYFEGELKSKILQ